MQVVLLFQFLQNVKSLFYYENIPGEIEVVTGNLQAETAESIPWVNVVRNIDFQLIFFNEHAFYPFSKVDICDRKRFQVLFLFLFEKKSLFTFLAWITV